MQAAKHGPSVPEQEQDFNALSKERRSCECRASAGEPTPARTTLVQYLTLFIVVGSFLGLLVFDSRCPARRFLAVRAWKTRGLISFGLYLGLSGTLPLLCDGWLARYRVMDLTGLGAAAGTVIALLALELGTDLWHRALHRFDLLWRWFRQMHHSAERVDTAGAFFFSPLDIAGFTLAGTLHLRPAA
jgi:sterol desaturase/sphingolipid hydroxylase (fatty acid hydroxylase superfamily)